MQLTTFALAAVLPLISAYPITADDVNCRAGPRTSDEVVKTYALNDEVEISCQTYGELISGNAIWDKTQDDCYVTDYYVKTGSDGMVTDKCEGTGGGDDSEYEGPITRDQIMARADFWIQQHIPYSMEAYEPDMNGRDYRTDCSGFVSMALHASAPGYSTVTMGDIAESISYDDIQAGDFVGTLAAGTGGAGGHVVIFHSWVDDSHSVYNTVECKGTDGCVAYQREVGWGVGSYVAEPFRYIRLSE